MTATEVFIPTFEDRMTWALPSPRGSGEMIRTAVTL